MATFLPSRRDRDRLYYEPHLNSAVAHVIIILGPRTVMGKRAVDVPYRPEIFPMWVRIARPAANPARHTLPSALRPRPLPGQKTPGLSTRTRAATAPLLAALAASFPAEISLLAF